MFQDRLEAAGRLADRLRTLGLTHPWVVGLPRGGVPMAVAVAQALEGRARVVCVRKIPAPWSPELALGALAEGDVVVWDRDAVWPDATGTEQRAAVVRQQPALAECQQRYGEFLLGEVGGEQVVVDDGAATGSTMVAALQTIAARRPSRLVAAVPVAAREAVGWIERYAETCVTLATPPWFGAVSTYYRDFSPVSDEAALAWLRRAASS